MAVVKKIAVVKREIGGDVPTNGARETIELSQPYVATVTIEGVCDMLFHAWNCEAVEEKSRAAKGSKAKKTDDLESYVYRCEDGTIGLPGEYMRMPIIGAAKYKQDPRSPRKSAQDLYKAGIVVLTEIATLGQKHWDYDHKKRVKVQQSAITRTRPAIKAGWRATFDIMVNLSEYIPPHELADTIDRAGRFCGTADYRPTYGRFRIVNWELRTD